MEQFIKDLGKLGIDLLINLPALGIIAGYGERILKRWFSNLTEEINQKLKDVEDRMTAIEKAAIISHKELEKEILRLQLLEGINSKRLSESEVAYFYDKYKAAGGNSFVSEKVHDYLEELNGEKEE